MGERPRNPAFGAAQARLEHAAFARVGSRPSQTPKKVRARRNATPLGRMPQGLRGSLSHVQEGLTTGRYRGTDTSQTGGCHKYCAKHSI
jgi:hypothetical protein